MTDALKLKVRRWICAPCVRVKDGGKEVRVKNSKPLRSHQCPQLRDCAGEEQVNFSHWSASLSLLLSVSEPPPPPLSLSPPPPPAFQLGHQLCWSPLCAVIRLQIRLSCCRKSRPLRGRITVSMEPEPPMDFPP